MSRAAHEVRPGPTLAGGASPIKPDRRSRVVLALAAVVLLLVGAEVVLELTARPLACVEVVNLGAEPIEGAKVGWGTTLAELPRIAPGESARVYLTGDGQQDLRLTFRQAGNALTSFQVPGFDPAQMVRDDFKLVLRLRTNEVERYQDDAEPSTPLRRRLRDLQNWLSERFHLND